MGDTRGSRFQSSTQKSDIEESIINLSKAILVSSPLDASPSFPIIVEPFYSLALHIFFRAVDLRWPDSEDVNCCIRYFRYLHQQWHQFSMKFPIPVPTVLTQTLALHVELNLGGVDEDIEEMADLCDELFKSDIWIQFVIRPIAALARAINVYLKDHLDWNIRSDKVINCLRRAILRLPDLHEVTLLLAGSLYDRFAVARSHDGYQLSMEILDPILIFRGSGDEPSPYREDALLMAAALAEARFDASGKPEHLEHAIYRRRALVDGTSIEHPSRATFINLLSYLERLRFDGNANTHSWLYTAPKSGKLPSFRELIASFPAMVAEPDLLTHIYTHTHHLDTLLPHIDQLTDVAYIEDGIKYCRLLVSRGLLAFPAQLILGKLLYRAFQLTHKIEYLNEAISSTRGGRNAADSFYNRNLLAQKLIPLLSIRLDLQHHEEDLHELMQLFPTVAHYTSGNLPLSFRWASIARRVGHASASTAYEHAMSWMQFSLTFAPTLDKQHSRLVGMHGLHTIPLDYTSYHIHTGNLGKAIETLEQGRGLLWSQIRGLRTSIEQLRLADSDLAKEFSVVNRKLEALIMTPSLNNNVDGNNGLQGMDSYGHRVIQKQKLLDDREKLITRIRALPGFDTFLKPPSFDTLCSAASHGPVIIINHCKWRSDILILHPNSPPSLIPTSGDFYIRANKLQDQLLGNRKMGLESNAYEDALRATLRELYELVGQPVIKRLNELNIPEQSRIWWCPTSVFCSLPLHAMGPIPSDVGPPRYFLDLYIPSYTPSLSALIDSHKPDLQTFEKPSILLVLQPDAYMEQALDEMKAVQRASSRAITLIGASATPSVVLKRLRDHRFVHIVCHGVLEPGRPFDSSFKLYQGKRLSLHDIVQPQLPNAEFAFLAACHTAELTDESPADEALHLAAAMQYCGFRSVVGTMWAMADTDGWDLAENFYKLVFFGGKRGVCYYERTAEALRDAVVRLRRRKGIGITLERWVNYVHYGA